MSYVFNFLRINKELEKSDSEDTFDFQWLYESYANPAKFWQDIFNYQSSQFSMLAKTFPGEYYDFYHDIIIRNFDSERIAFQWHDERTGWQKLSFRDLHFKAEEEAQRWTNKGVKAGQTICFILPMGVRYLVSLITALRMGVLVSFLPPYGDRFLAKRLKLLAPDYIVTDYIYTSILGPFEKLLLDKQEDKPQVYEGVSYTYLSGSPFGKLFAPFSKDSHIPRVLSCDDAYLWAVRDGMLSFSLRHGDIFAAPGFDSYQYQPGLLLATLLAGATYLHLEIKDIEQNPNLLNEFQIRMLGVNRDLREILTQKPPQHPPWEYLFRSCTEPFQWEKWLGFIKKLAIDKVPIGNILYHTASGGCLLFSLRNTGKIGLDVIPSPGIKWQLSDLNLSGQKAYADFGIWDTPEHEADKTPLGCIILCKREKSWFFMGTRDPRKECKSFPAGEVLDILSPLSFIVHASIFSIAIGNEGQHAQHILLIFVGSCTNDYIEEKRKDWVQEIHSAIHLHLGSEFLPDKIEFYPLYAHEKEGILNHAWCQSQYLTGYLYRKSQHKIYQMLTELKSLTSIRK